MIKNLTLLFLSALIILHACNPVEKKTDLPKPALGSWLMKMQLDGVVLPFSFEISRADSVYVLTITNAEEEIYIEEVSVFKDSIKFNMPVFESAFHLKMHSADSMSGVWINYYKSADYVINVWANRTDIPRFAELSHSGKNPPSLKSKYEVEFSPGEADAYKAIGLFEVEGNLVKGTIATETGDYRFLEGRIIGDSLYLSTFDGSHAFFFSAGIEDSVLEGIFISGIHHREKWIAQHHPDFELRNPDSLTTFADSAPINFRLPNVGGETISLTDSRFENKVKLIQIMGSWCPNCLDESRYFNQLYKTYADQGLEIIALAFERTRSKARAIENINKLISREGLSYPFLLGGYNRDQHPNDVFPMLDKIISYPTTIFLDKNNQVKKVHTGFYGPGTGKYYEEYKAKTESFINDLLKES